MVARHRADEILGIAVGLLAGPRLLAKIEGVGSDIYFLPTHDEELAKLDDGTLWNPHSSFHASGQHHLKTYNTMIFAPQRRQRPNDQFRGTEPLFDLSVRAADWSRAPSVDPSWQAAELFTIPEALLSEYQFYTVSAHLTEPGVDPTAIPYRAAFIADHRFAARAPWIHVSIWGLLQ